jgi:hypothetical protein
MMILIPLSMDIFTTTVRLRIGWTPIGSRPFRRRRRAVVQIAATMARVPRRNKSRRIRFEWKCAATWIPSADGKRTKRHCWRISESTRIAFGNSWTRTTTRIRGAPVRWNATCKTELAQHFITGQASYTSFGTALTPRKQRSEYR